MAPAALASWWTVVACPGAKGRLASIAFHRERSDGSYDVVVEAGRSFTLSNEIWGVAPSTQSRVPPYCTLAFVWRMRTTTQLPTSIRAVLHRHRQPYRRTLSSASSPSDSAQSNPTLSPRPLWVPAAKDVARKLFRAVRVSAQLPREKVQTHFEHMTAT